MKQKVENLYETTNNEIEQYKEQGGLNMIKLCQKAQEK